MGHHQQTNGANMTTTTGSKAPTQALMVLIAVATVIACLVVPTSGGPTVKAATRVNVTRQCNTVDIVRVTITGYDRNLRVSIEPTGRARVAAQLNSAMWDQLWRCIPYPSGLYGWQGDSMYKQLLCHSFYSIGIPGSSKWTGGPTWDLETWRSNVSWSRASQVWSHSCNWA